MGYRVVEPVSDKVQFVEGTPSLSARGQRRQLARPSAGLDLEQCSSIRAL